MREVKFRGKSQVTGEWVTGTYIEGYIINGIIEANSEYIVIEDWKPVHPESVGQYAGMKDVNGVEIYEGDIDEYGYIVSYVDGSEGGDLGMEIGFHLQRDNFESWSKMVFGEAVKVVGNIHDNSESSKL